MHRITASILAIFVVIPAWGDVRLPVVNVASAGVSARAAFGEPVYQPATVSVAPVAKTRVAKTEKVTAGTRGVVSRAAVKSAAPVDRGEKIATVSDVLIPHRPSSDLWAKNEAPLRMPSPSEFSVMRSDFDLPEESLDSSMSGRSFFANDIRNTPAASQPVTTREAMSEFDNQLAKLAELQRRADDSVAPRPSQIVAEPIPTIAKNDVVVPEIPEIKTPVKSVADENPTVKLSRLVVPMDEQDVVMRTVEKKKSPTIAAVRNDMTKMSPSELRRAFRKTFLSENKHLSTFAIDDRFDVASDMSSGIEGFTAVRDLSETGGIRPLEVKIRFRNEDSALSRDNYTLLTEYASIVVSNPKRAIQVAIPESATVNADDRKLAARRLAIIEQVLRDTGVAEQRVLPVLSSRNDDAFVLRIISGDQYETLTQQQRNIFGDSINKKSYKSMSW